MAITFQAGTSKGTNAGDGRTGDGTLTVNFPTGYTTTANHLALIILYHDQGTGSIPTNWSQVSGSPWGAGTEKLQAFYLILAGGESAPVTTISGSGTNISHCANMAIYSGVDTTTPIDSVGTASNGTGTPMTAGAIDPPTDDAMVLGLCGRGDNENSSGQTFGGSATGVTEQLDGGTTAGNDSQVSMYDKLIASGSSGNGSADTSVTDPWVSVLIALKPGFQTFTQTLATTAIGVVTLAAVKTVLKSLVSTATGLATLTTALLFTASLPTTGTATVTLSPVPVFTKLLSTVATGINSIGLTVGTTLSTVAVALVGIGKKVFKTLDTTAVGISSLTTSLLFSESLSTVAVVQAALSIVKTFIRTLSTIATGVVSLTADFISGSGAGYLNHARTLGIRLGLWR